VQFNGNGSAGSSVYQEMELQGVANDSIRGNVVTASVQFRGYVAGNVELALWFKDLGTAAATTCSITPNAWQTCTLANVQMPANSGWIARRDS
jgi:hypothetical protein